MPIAFGMDAYTYQPLPTPHHTRILTLYPAHDHTAPLHCSLNPVDLDFKEPYSALSYVWGSTEEMSSLLCDGKTVQMIPNCESALRHLRHIVKDVVLWIDALCIDQKNLEERAQKVMIMGKIYQQAEQVVIWLGAGSKEIEGGFSRANLALKTKKIRILCLIVHPYQRSHMAYPPPTAYTYATTKGLLACGLSKSVVIQLIS
ncbi:hypothetical protein BS50DRAFT_134812 [Corynespora cassiicola Philippines]|uniref:Heterokaryon incompatibility domain-containing protein n=1 Tax=Corynespora cassiicola Philippines TaxID=1448308 RepID=A0A2T2N995_CORCC|nr:hypothetical protein BS50DRAFT_134812 [Corynespora cassiicola Philippines]